MLCARGPSFTALDFDPRSLPAHLPTTTTTNLNHHCRFPRRPSILFHTLPLLYTLYALPGRAFRIMDSDGSGSLTLPEFQIGMNREGFNASDKDVTVLFKYIDADHSGGC